MERCRERAAGSDYYTKAPINGYFATADSGTETEGEQTMRYILMMHAPRATGDYQINSWSPEDFQAHMEFMHSFNRELTNSGELVGAEGLAAPGEAKLVRAGKNGVPVTDGPFPEAKEFLAGYWIVDVNGPERAYEIAARASAAPGPGGAPLNMGIEVRQVMSTPPADA